MPQRVRDLVRYLVRVGLAVSAAAEPVAGQEAWEPSKVFEKRQVMIPMRDGVKLRTEIFSPKTAGRRLPILLQRSPWVVKLIDVYPETYPSNPALAGHQLMIADEVIRAKFRKSFSKPEPVVPARVIEYVIDLEPRSHRFLKGHKIMVQVQSTWFPLIDRNPQTFVNIPTAKASDFQKATHRIYRSARSPSHLRLTV
jgi:predicted acyl esterase